MKGPAPSLKAASATSANNRLNTIPISTKLGTSSIEKPKQYRKTNGKAIMEIDKQNSWPSMRKLDEDIQVIGVAPAMAAEGVDPFAKCHIKLKLQLFPIDNFTRRGLEKNKYNPYLELTLGMQKKISSVVKHLNTKWGKSGTACGELMLVPFDAQRETLRGHRWTSKDSGTTVAHVYAAAGCPAVFRLRYGWFSSPCLKKENPHFASISENGCHMVLSDQDGVSRPNQVNPVSSCELLNKVASTTKTSDTSSGKSGDGETNSGASFSWINGVSNMSFGELLLKSSKPMDGNSCQQVSASSQSSLHQIPLTCDSFDAAIAAQIARIQATNSQPSAHVSQPSIWDSEETCDAFLVQKIPDSLRGANVMGHAHLNPINPDLTPNTVKIHELGSAVNHAQESGCQEPKISFDDQTKPLVQRADIHHGTLTTQDMGTSGLLSPTEGLSNGYQDLAKIDFSLSESMGPFLSGLSSSRQMLGGENLSLGSLNTGSLDAVLMQSKPSTK